MRTKDQFEKIRDFYNEEYYANIEKSAQKLPWHYNIVVSRLGNLEGKHVLDIACGSGEWLDLLESKGAVPTGLDISERAIKVAKRKLKGADLRVGEAEMLPFKSGVFDIVSCMGSIEHFIEPEKAIREMARVAKPNAKFLLLVPNKDFIQSRLGLYSGTDQAKVQEILRSLDGWSKLFEKAGLKVDRRWRDLHILNFAWVLRKGWLQLPLRLAVALILPVLPMSWQYQVYHYCSAQKR